MYENRDSALVKAFFNCGNRAIKNNIWLNTTMQPRIHEGRKFYEVNPYSDVFCLASLLLKHQNITLIHTEAIGSYRKFKDLLIIRKNEIIFISFFFDGSQSILKRNLEQFFSVFDENDNKMDVGISLNSDSVIRKEDSVKIEITLKSIPNSPVFLHIIENDVVLVCVI